jgi:two-component system sensor histidine kinase KdpD
LPKSLSTRICSLRAAFLNGIGILQPAPSSTWASYVKSLLLVGLLTVAGLFIEPLAAPTNTAMLYLFSVLYIALRWGSGPALVFSFAGAVAFDFFFIPPQRTFTTNDTWYLITLIAFLSIGVITSVLASSTREQARAAINREAQTLALYSLTRSLSAARSLQQVLLAAAGHMKEVFGCESAVLLADGAGDQKPCFQSSGWDLPLAEAGTISVHISRSARIREAVEKLILCRSGRETGSSVRCF